MNIDGCNDLAIAIVTMAIDDWRNLCKCKRKDRNCRKCKDVKKDEPMPACVHRETARCNFKELAQFFREECHKYLVHSEIGADAILGVLLRERAVSKKSLPTRAK